MRTFSYKSIVAFMLTLGILLNLVVVFKLPAIQSTEIAEMAQFMPYFYFTLSAMAIFVLGWHCGNLGNR